MRAAIPLALLFAISVSSPRAEAQTEAERAQARAAFQRGVQAFEASRFEVALEAFQEAYRIAPHPSVRVNMANCYESMDRPVEAIFHFERFLLEAGDAPEVQREEVRQAVARLRQGVGEVFLRVEPEGAEVTIDEEQTRRAPILDAVRLVEGTHRIQARAPGHVSQERIVSVRGGERSEVRVTLVPGTEPAPAVPLSPEPPAEPSEVNAGEPGTAVDSSAEAPEREGSASEDGSGAFNTPALITGGVAAGLAITAIALGISALGANGDFDDAVARSNDPAASGAERQQARADGLDAKDRANRRSLAADLLGVGAVLAAGVSAYFLFFHDPGEGDVSLSAAPLRRGGALSLGGSF